MDNYLYLLINTAVIAVPLAASFGKKVCFISRWKSFIPAITLTATVFIIWDIFFTAAGVWGFNPKYLTGIYVAGLPLEELLFFITVPYACLFTYEAIKYYVKYTPAVGSVRIITFGLSIVLLIIGTLLYDRAYTSVTFISTAVFLIVSYRIIGANILGKFYIAYAFILIPFFIVNGLLTGFGIEEEVVWYNAAEFSTIRLFTIPIEDSIYGMLLILMNVVIYESINKKKSNELSG